MSVARELADLPSASPSTDANFDNGTFVVDISTNRVGVGTTVPASALDVAGTVQVGINGTGHDVKFFGATSGAWMQWDENVDTLVVSEGVLAGLTTGDFSMQSTARATVSNCTYSFKDDPDTGMIRTAANAFALVTAGVNRFQIIADGKVGVGTITPVTSLTVEGTLTLKERAEADTNTASYGQLWVNTATPNELYFTADDDTDIQITTATGINAASTGKAIAMAMVFGG